jgi:hypothetical protein
MSQEIIYTSAPRGLKIGSKGFCTVASTRNMAKPLAERLEALSGYRHLFPPGDLRNPVTYSHIILTIAGKRYHVLSRVADAGYDYSQRSNKIAHHVALTEQETVSAGPAWLLSQPAFMASIWSREPSFFESGRVPPSGLLEPAVCETWQNVAGDAGWAGVLAETVLSSDQNEVYLIYNEAMDVLRLILEAQALLPESSRWLATFTTNYTKLPPNVECRWRCVLEGSDEAAQIQRLRHVMVLDLSKPIGQPTLSAAVDAARNGRSIVGNKAHSPTAISDVGLDLTGYSPPRDMVSSTASSTPPQRELELRLAPFPPPRPPNVPPHHVRSHGTRRRVLTWFAGSCVAASILAVVAATAYWLGTSRAGIGTRIAEITSTHQNESGPEQQSPTDRDNSTSLVTSERKEEVKETISQPPSQGRLQSKSDLGPSAAEAASDEQSTSAQRTDNTDSSANDANKQGRGAPKEAQGPTASDTPPLEKRNDDANARPKEPVTQSISPKPADVVLSDKKEPTDPPASAGDAIFKPTLNSSIEIRASSELLNNPNEPRVSLGKTNGCKGLDLCLIHPEFEAVKQQDSAVWIVRRRNGDLQELARILIDNQDLFFQCLSQSGQVMSSLTMGALQVKWDDAQDDIILLRKDDPATVELRLARIETDGQQSKTRSLRLPVYTADLVRISHIEWRSSHPLFPSGAKDLTDTTYMIPSVPQVSATIEVTIQCVRVASDEQRFQVRAAFRCNGMIVDSKAKKRAFEEVKRLGPRERDLKQRIDLVRSQNAENNSELGKELDAKYAELKNVQDQLQQSQLIVRLNDGLNDASTPIIVAVKLCYLYEKTRIPISEKDFQTHESQ